MTDYHPTTAATALRARETQRRRLIRQRDFALTGLRDVITLLERGDADAALDEARAALEDAGR